MPKTAFPKSLPCAFVFAGLLAAAALPVLAETSPAAVEPDVCSVPAEALLAAGGGSSILSCSATSTCSNGTVIHCSCPGTGTCTDGGTYVECLCDGAPDDEDNCPGPSCPPPGSKCIAGKSCGGTCADSVCGGGTCWNGQCNCEI